MDELREPHWGGNLDKSHALIKQTMFYLLFHCLFLFLQLQWFVFQVVMSFLSLEILWRRRPFLVSLMCTWAAWILFLPASSASHNDDVRQGHEDRDPLCGYLWPLPFRTFKFTSCQGHMVISIFRINRWLRCSCNSFNKHNSFTLWSVFKQALNLMIDEFIAQFE
jgi:hypothetical protein